ncbi:MAG: HD domain-containing protein [Deltaproteobacteria bacterium]|nr:HD domain-containing protein [Deltaproteobacteria bacterium]
MAEEKTRIAGPEEKAGVPERLPAKMGPDFVMKFYRLLKGAMLYEPNNSVIERLTHECRRSVNSIIRSEGRLYLKIVRDNFFFNNIRLQVQADLYSLFKSFSQEMAKRWIGELEFTEEVSAAHLRDFVYLLFRLEENKESNYLLAKRQLGERSIRSIDVGKLEFFKDEEIYVDSDEQKKSSKRVYFKAISLLKEVVEGVRNQKVLNVRKAKHLMQNAVNCIMQDESTLLGLANIKNYDEYTFNHSVNVAIYAIALGLRIGIPKKHLSHLGMAGLFHDIGKTRIPKEILNKTERLLPEEWALIRSHPLIGAEIVIRMKEWGELSTRMIEAAFEHHLKYDLSGYPKLIHKTSLTLFGKIITVLDFYDALVRPRVYRRFPYVSEKILGFMMERARKDFDPALVKVFINMIGIYPVGTLVSLDTQEIGIVLKTQEDPELLDRPLICLLRRQEEGFQKGEVVDLKEIDEATRRFKRTIVQTLDPNDYNLHVGEFLI